MSKKVVVAMSGGVDSSVAALLLKEQGYEVFGITMQIWQDKDIHTGACCSLDAVNDARRVASLLDIPHYVFNFRDQFRNQVIDYFCLEYLRGRTPNPCIACNRYLKFDALLSKALAMHINYLATGHYARIIRMESTGRWSLFAGIDPAKDQSYALYSLSQHQLQHSLFPLGNYTKSEVRKLASAAGLSVAAKAESQDLCFVADGRYGDFVERHMKYKASPGRFRSSTGDDVGPHRGIHHYTIGQRKGLGLALGYPAYVTEIDVDHNTIRVGPNEELYSQTLQAENMNYISGIPLNSPRKAAVKIRYSSAPVPAWIAPLDDGNRIRVDFEIPQRAITSGQAAVIYDRDEVIGGGTIYSSSKS